MKKAFLSIIAILCIAFAAVLFYYNNISIPKLKKTIANETVETFENNSVYKPVAFITSEEGIEKNTIFTDEIVRDGVNFIKVPEQYVLGDFITDEAQLIGKTCTEALRKGEPIHVDRIKETGKSYGGMERLREYTVHNTVGNLLTEGCYIDVLVSYQDGTYDVVVAKEAVIAIVNGNTNSDEETNNTIKYNSMQALIVISVDEQQYSALEKAKQLGRLEVRLYHDDNQPSSKVTFKEEVIQ